MFEITLRWSSGAALEQEEIVLHLVGIQFGGQAVKMQRHCRHVARIVLVGFAASAQHGNVALETSQQLTEAGHFTAGTVHKFVFPQFLGSLFFVVIMLYIKRYYYLCKGNDTICGKGYRRFSSTRVCQKRGLSSSIEHLCKVQQQ